MQIIDIKDVDMSKAYFHFTKKVILNQSEIKGLNPELEMLLDM